MQDMMTVSGDFIKQSIESASSSNSSNRDKSGGQNPQHEIYNVIMDLLQTQSVLFG